MPSTMFARSCIQVDCPAGEIGMLVVSEGNAYDGLGQYVGQSVSTTCMPV